MLPLAYFGFQVILIKKLKEEKNSNFSWHFAAKSLENLFPGMTESFDDLFEDMGQSTDHSPIEGERSNVSIDSK